MRRGKPKKDLGKPKKAQAQNNTKKMGVEGVAPGGGDGECTRG